MPLYEYQCKKCGHRFEKIQKFSDPVIKKCPECKGAVERLISSPAIQFKGTGWYVTDYAGKTAPKEEPKTTATATEDKPAETKKEPAKDKASDKGSDTGSKASKKK